MSCFFCGPIDGDVLEHQASQSHATMVELVNSLDDCSYWPSHVEVEPLESE